MVFFLFALTFSRVSAAAVFVPPPGKVLLVIGSDKKSMVEYVRDIKMTPGGFMIYTSIQEAGGLFEQNNHGAGDNHGQYF